MPSIFAWLAVGQLIVLIGSATLGVIADRMTSDRHVVLAVFSLLLSCLIQVVAFTYLTVTGKMIVQAVHLGHLDLQPVHQAKALKRTWTHLLAVLIAAMVLATASGAHAWRSGQDNRWHLLAATVVITAHALILYRQFGLILANASLVRRTLDTYSRHKEAASSAVRRKPLRESDAPAGSAHPRP